MNCKFCNEPLEDGVLVCPKCKKKQPATPKKPKAWQLVVAIVGCVALLGALTVAVLEGMGIDATGKIASIFTGKKEDTTPTEDAKPEFPEIDTVVATIGDRELTNGELQVYYWTHVFDYINQYYYSGLGFRTETALDVQVKDTATGQTWHEYFLDMAFKTWQRYEAMSIIAGKANVSLSQESQDYLDSLPTYLADTAAQNNFASVDEMIADRFGPGCAYRHYVAFIENYLIGLDFVGMMTDSLNLTEEEIEKYYNDNLEELKKAGATKDDGNISNVRHILICPKSEDEKATTFTDAQWAAALASAESVLAEWNAGEATESSFTALAQKYSEDPGVTTNAGLYEQVTKNSGYVTAFENWAYEPTRKAGDTGIVKTEYGYHIMYCVSTDPLWRTTCETAMITERLSAEIDTCIKDNPITTYGDKVVVGDALADKNI